jgi:hypothetical protein
MPQNGAQPARSKPLAGNCPHRWLEQESPYLVAQLCELCRLFRYKSSPTADWEYRAPIPIGRLLGDDNPAQ